MNFFEHQDRARRNTVFLVVSYTGAVAVITLAVAILLTLIFGEVERRPGGAEIPLREVFRSPVFPPAAGGTLILILAGSLYKITALSGGGAVVAGLFGGLPIPTDTRAPDLRRLMNVVEEMAIASGTPVPPVYLIEEDGINAFAAGFRPEDAVIAVTRGCVHRLNRDELQGVIAHEFSHILNGDMRTNIRMMGVLHGILLIAMIGNLIFRGGIHSGGHSRRRSSDSGNEVGGAIALMLIGLALMIIGYIGVFFGKLIKSAVSRQREFLADASAVQFTRYPEGIAGALKKIGGYAKGSRIWNPHAEEASHFFFGNALAGSVFPLFSTHPPIEDRIRRLDPSFDGDYEKSLREAPPERGESMVSGFASTSAPTPEKIRTTPEEIVRQAGTPTRDHLEYARGLHQSIPARLRDAVHDAYGARAVVHALLLDSKEEVREKQFAWLRSHTEPLVYRDVVGFQKIIASLDPRMRLPLIDLAVPALTHLSDAQYEVFIENVKNLIQADERVSLFEYAVQSLLVRHLTPKFKGPIWDSVKYADLGEVQAECGVLISALAHAGGGREDQARKSFEAAAGRLGGLGDRVVLHERSSLSLVKIRESLGRLRLVAPKAKKQLIEAGAAAVVRDGEITLHEAELLRIVCDSLGCPMPPILARETA